MPIELPDVLVPTAAQRELMPRALALLSDEEPCALFYDLERLREILCSIKEAFPASATHAIAMKANPLAACLLIARDLGMGCEVASPGEFEHALRLGFAPAQIVMDSPAKTRRDLRRALAAGVRLNADNFDELARIDEILAAEYGGGGLKGLGSCKSPSIGVRVNPQLGEGAIAATGTVAPTSKFGVALTEVKQELLEAYDKYAWLSSVHVHVGSQGCPVTLLVQASRAPRPCRRRPRHRPLRPPRDPTCRAPPLPRPRAGRPGGARPRQRDQRAPRRPPRLCPRPRRRHACRLRLRRARRGAGGRAAPARRPSRL